MSIPVKLILLDDGMMPKYGSAGASGADLYAAEDVIIRPGETALIRTGVRLHLPEISDEVDDPLFEVQIRPRSGVSAKTKLRVANSPGTVDHDFQGEIKVIIDNIAQVQYHGNGWATRDSIDVRLIDGSVFAAVEAYPVGTYLIRKGDRIAQAVLTVCAQMDFEVVSSFDTETERGDGGFGSTGTR